MTQEKEDKLHQQVRKLRKSAEEALLSRPRDALNIDTNDVERLVQELTLYQSALEVQNEHLRQVQAELEASRNKYQDLYDFAPVGHFMLDKDMRIVEVNLAGATLLGMERARLVIRNFTRFVAPESQDAFYFHHKDCLEKGASETREVALRKSDGTQFQARLDSAAVKVADGRANMCRVAVIDISRRAAAEKALQESRQLLQGMADLNPDIIYIYDLNGKRVVYANRSLATVLGHTTEHLREFPDLVKSLVHPDDYKTAMQHLSQVAMVPDSRTLENEVRFKHANGDYRWFQNINVVFKRDANGRPLQTLGISRDVTPRRLAEEALRQSEEKYRRIVETANEGIWVTDRDGRTVLVNKRMAEILGDTEEEMLGKSFLEFIGPEERPGVLERREKRHSGISEQYDIRLRRKDGGEVWVTVKAAPLGSDGKLVGHLGMVTDITRHKLADEALARARDELEVRVSERTADLQKSAEYLKREVTRRKKSEAELRVLSRRLVEVQEAERSFMARELHDEVGQYLTGLKLSLERLEQMTPEKAAAKLSEAKGILGELITIVRRLSLELRPSMLDELGLLQALLWYTERYTSQTGVHVDFRHFNLDVPMSSAVKVAVYRIIQEALTNVARHSGVKEASVKAYTGRGRVHVQIEDHGGGFDARMDTAHEHSFGLTSMRERSIAVGGRLTIRPAPGSGTRVVADLPLVEPPEKGKTSPS